MKKSIYITTTLPYVNADPHIGFALEIIQADAFARIQRLLGKDVFFSTGTDEHGQKIYEAAQKAGKGVQEYVDFYAGEFRKLKSTLNLSVDNFIRTTDSHHEHAAQEMWRRCAAAGDIYKKSYKGKYCVGCEAFKTDKDLDEQGRCMLHPSLEIQTLEEENYFFRFSNYQDKLRAYLQTPGVILPEWRREEALTFVENGLEDFSISREKARLSWGVQVPEDESQVMYVWFDALTNYISTLGWPDESTRFENFWSKGTTVQMAGKDQIRFQSLMWQAMLFSAGIKNTDLVVYHGFINSDGQRMSKSLGNVVNPYTLVEKYGTDATRYFLLAKMNPFDDSDFTYERFEDAYQADLANGLGNLVARVAAMAEKTGMTADEHKPTLLPPVQSAMETYEYNTAIDHIWGLISEADKTINEKKVWELDGEEQIAILNDLINRIRQIAFNLQPFMPETAEKILKQYSGEIKKGEALFPRLQY